MRSIKIKTTCYGNIVNATLAHPDSPLGDIRDASVQIRQINNIPDGIDQKMVISMFSQTCDVSGLFGAGRLELDYKDLGVGKIIK